MKDKEKQIEEMVSIMAASNNPFVDVPIEIMPKVAEALYNAGYRKLPKDSILLSREELSEEPYNDFCKGCPNVRVRSSGMTDCCADYSCEQFQKYARLLEFYKQIRKETAEKIFNDIFKLEVYDDGWNKMYYKEHIKELAKQFGLEIKE